MSEISGELGVSFGVSVWLNAVKVSVKASKTLYRDFMGRNITELALDAS